MGDLKGKLFISSAGYLVSDVELKDFAAIDEKFDVGSGTH